MELRALLGYALYCVGGSTMAFVGGRYAVGEWERESARRSWNEAQANAVVSLARRTALAGGAPPGLMVPGAPVARLLIPRLRMDEIVLEGIHIDALNAGPGHLPGSAFPGERGNSIISAHRDRHFSRLGAIAVGDTLYTESGSRQTSWVVISKRVVDADAPALFRTSDATLTLTTCWPIGYLGAAPERLLVTAKPLKRASFASAPAT